MDWRGSSHCVVAAEERPGKRGGREIMDVVSRRRRRRRPPVVYLVVAAQASTAHLSAWPFLPPPLLSLCFVREPRY